MQDLAKTLNQTLEASGLTLSTAESCTGGLISKLITDPAGASAVFLCGFVTYSNEAKQALLGVSAQTLERYGAVSQQTAEEMVKGALLKSGADLAISVTGIAGPGGATASKPVGTVYIGYGRHDDIRTEKHQFEGNREMVREQAAKAALEHLMAFVS